MKMGYKSVGKFEVQEIIELINGTKPSVILAGFKINVSSARLKNFAVHGTDCICCGIKGSYFSVETSNNDPTTGLHLNLYAINDQGHPVLMTKDHIVLKSLGGSDTVDNYSPMCLRCNNLRGNMYPIQQEFIDAYKNGEQLRERNCGIPNPESKRQISLKSKRERLAADQINHKAHVYSFFKNVKYSNNPDLVDI